MKKKDFFIIFLGVIIPWMIYLIINDKIELANFIITTLAFGAAIYAIYYQHKESKQAEKNFQTQLKEIKKASAWQVLANKASGNSGKKEAIQFLASQGLSLCGIDMSRKTHGGKVYLADLFKDFEGDRSEIDLTDAKFSKAILFDADFSRFNLKYVNFSGAELFGAVFSGAWLDRADFSETYFENADFSEADLLGANFSGATLFGADFSRTYLEKINFSGATLFGANFSEADPIEANFSGATLFGANFSKTYFENADFSRTYLEKINFSGATLFIANFSKADLFIANFSKTYFENADFSGATLFIANFSGADFSNCTIQNMKFTNTNFTNTNFSQVKLFNDNNFTHCYCWFCNDVLPLPPPGYKFEFEERTDENNQPIYPKNNPDYRYIKLIKLK